MTVRSRALAWTAALAVVGAALAVLVVSYATDLRRGIRAVDAPPSQVFGSGFGDIENPLQGSGPAVLVSHGITGGVDQGAGLAATDLGSGYRLLLVSRFGYLKSSLPPEASAAAQARAYRDLLDHLRIERVLVFGNSAGGTSALQFAIAYPQRCAGLILVSTNVPGGPAARPPRPALAQMSREERSGLVRGILLGGLPISRRTRGILFDMYVSNPSIGDPLPFAAISAPTLLLHAEDDPACLLSGARVLSGSIPGSTLHVFPAGGHLLLGHEAESRDLVRAFVQKISAQVPGAPAAGR